MSRGEEMRSVVLAAVAGSSRLFEKLGGTEALHAVERCMKRMSRGIDGFHGRIVRTGRHDLMAIFANVNDACQAAIAMQRRIADLPPISGVQLAIRIGFHHGPVVEAGGEFIGDCVNTAECLAGLAGAGQILTNRETRALLAPGLRDSTRPLAKGPAANRAGEQQIFEVIWHEQRAEHARPVGELPSEAKERELRLCVRYGRSVKLLDKHRQSLHMGRDGDCEIIIRDRRASRQHALIERRGDLFVLKDVSTNGTFVTVHGESELFVLHEEFVLRGSGVISFAASAGTPSADIAEFEHV